MRALNEWRRDLDQKRAAEEVEAEALVRNMATLSKAVDDLRGTLTKFYMTLAGSSVIFALSILVATGKVG